MRKIQLICDNCKKVVATQDASHMELLIEFPAHAVYAGREWCGECAKKVADKIFELYGE